MAVITIAQPDRYKVGSTWRFPLRRTNPDGTPINLSGLEIRAVFKIGAVDGELLAELTEGAGIERDDANGRIVMEINAVTSATAPASSWIYFEAEMIASDGYVWQSPTYRFKTEAQVTL